MNLLNLDLPPQSQINKERRQAEAELRKTTARRRAREQRAYQAAVINRLTSDWATAQTSANYELRSGLRNLRARSRDLSRNNDYIKKFLSMVRSNVIGPAGIKLQMRVKGPNGALKSATNQRIEDAFTRWGHAETASASGKLSWIDAQLLAVRTLARDGEFLARHIVADNEFGYSLHFIDVNWLDETYNDVLPNGNRVMMSIEVDAYSRPVAYYLTPPASDYYQAAYPSIRQRTRVPADQIIHKFLVYEDGDQVRGAPWAHTAMMRLQILGGYEEAELVAARLGACKMGFIIPPAGDEFAGIPDEESDGETPMLEDSEPGSWQEMRPGYDIKTFDPQHPNANYDQFTKSVLRGIASGLDVAYCSLSNDLSSVNYSSIRTGMIEERDAWRILQQFMIEHFCRPVFRKWLESAFLKGILDGIPTRDMDKIKEPSWRPRGWAWVDPKNDVQSKEKELSQGITSLTDVISERGEDLEEVFEKISEERALAKQYGIELPPLGAPQKAPQQEAEEDENELSQK